MLNSCRFIKDGITWCVTLRAPYAWGSYFFLPPVSAWKVSLIFAKWTMLEAHPAIFRQAEMITWLITLSPGKSYYQLNHETLARLLSTDTFKVIRVLGNFCSVCMLNDSGEKKVSVCQTSYKVFISMCQQPSQSIWDKSSPKRTVFPSSHILILTCPFINELNSFLELTISKFYNVWSQSVW